jgi:hypothetical protein
MARRPRNTVVGIGLPGEVSRAAVMIMKGRKAFSCTLQLDRPVRRRTLRVRLEALKGGGANPSINLPGTGGMDFVEIPPGVQVHTFFIRIVPLGPVNVPIQIRATTGGGMVTSSLDSRDMQLKA